MALHRTRVGLHARNDVRFPEHDYEMIRRARIETLKMMSFTDLSVFQRLRRENADVEFIACVSAEVVVHYRYVVATV